MEGAGQATRDRVKVLELPFRNTRMGGLTIYFLYCRTCNKFIEPASRRRSKAGTHGEDLYEHPENHELAQICFSRSNSGRRDISFTEGAFPEGFERYVRQKWVIHAAMASVEEMEYVLKGEPSDEA